MTRLLFHQGILVFQSVMLGLQLAWFSRAYHGGEPLLTSIICTGISIACVMIGWRLLADALNGIKADTSKTAQYLRVSADGAPIRVSPEDRAHG